MTSFGRTRENWSGTVRFDVALRELQEPARGIPKLVDAGEMARAFALATIASCFDRQGQRLLMKCTPGVSGKMPVEENAR